MPHQLYFVKHFSVLTNVMYYDIYYDRTVCIMCTCRCCTINAETLKPGIICSNSKIPGGDAETWGNPGKPGTWQVCDRRVDLQRWMIDVLTFEDRWSLCRP